jgi:NCAIR mutase (PurE)-related protein
MASIVGSTKYGEGHQIVLKEADKMSASVASKFTSLKYKLGESVFSITKSAKAKDISTVIELAAGTATLYVKDEKQKVILIKGSERTC